MLGLFRDSPGDGDSLQRWMRYQVSRLSGNFNGTVPASTMGGGPPSLSFSTILSSLVGLFLVWFLGSCIWYRYLSPISDIPGPFLASFSRLWLIKSLLRGKNAIELSELHEKYGPFVRISPWEVSVCHADTVKKLYLQPLRKGTFYEFATYPDWRFQNPMSEPDPRRKVERSKTFAAGFAQTNLLRSEDAISGVVGQLLDHMDDHARRGAPMHLDRFFTYAAFDVVGEVLCSRPFGFLREGRDVNGAIATNFFFQELVTWASHLRELHYVAVSPVTTWLRLTPASWLAETAAAAVAARMARPAARPDMLGHWLRHVEQNPGRAGLREVMAQATNVVGAGSDTTSCLLQATLYHLLRRPEALARARAEVAHVGGGADRVVPFAAARGLPYLQACVREALRVHCPIPLTLPRLAPRGGVEVGGRWFPEGLTLSGSPWVLHRSRALWGDDVDEFRPERWLGDDAAQLDRFFMPFGAGFMSCPGQHLARIEALKIMATILRDYDLRLVSPEKEWQFKMCFAQVPHSWPVYVSKR